MVVYRSLPEGDRRYFYDYASYGFLPEEGPPSYDPDSIPERDKLGAKRGLYPDESSAEAAPLAVCRHHWFDARVRGAVHPAPGLAAVATPPENRRQGYVRELLAASLSEYRDRGARFSQLWPFQYRFYRRYGWDVAHERLRYEFDPAVLSFAADRGDSGRYRRIEADEYEALEPIYEAAFGGYDGSIERSAEWWRHRVFTGRDADPFVYAWERDGEVRAYVRYDVDDGDDGRILRVRELAYANREGALALLAFCFRHDSQVETVRFSVPADSRLLDLFADPDEVDCERVLGSMIRIVDVAESLAALSYPDVDERLVLAVEDPLVEWNDGGFALEVSSRDGSGHSDGPGGTNGAAAGAVGCEPTTAGPDARLDVAALSQLAVGHRSARDLAWAGRLEATADGAVDALDRLFPPRPTYLVDGF